MNKNYDNSPLGQGKAAITRRASAAAPCPVCRTGSKGCSQAEDGLIFCRGAERPPGFDYLGPAAGDPQFGLFRATAAPPLLPRRAHRHPPDRRRDWGRDFARLQKQFTPALREELAAQLGVPGEPLNGLAIGYTDSNLHRADLIGEDAGKPGGWVFFETDPAGRLVGGLVRYRNGKKLAISGGERGLFAAPGWDGGDGPLLVVAGPSDVVAAAAAGLACVGRPSDQARTPELIRLLSALPEARPVIVVGENDLKRDGTWPGRDGARTVAEALANVVRNPVFWALPPAGSKDVRSWLTAQTGPWPERGALLRDWLWTNRQPAVSASVGRPVLPYQPFPVELLPGPLAAFVSETSCAIGCDSAFVALTVLAVVASLIGTSRWVRLKRSWEEPGVVWAANLADSGSLKTPPFKAALRPLVALQKRLRTKFAGDLAEYERELAAWDESPADDRGEKPTRPVLQRVFVGDITVERLAEILEDNPKGTLLARDELSGWIGSFCRYRGKGGGSDLPHWLEMHSAGPLACDRKHGDRRTIFVEEAALSLAGTIQPGVFRRAMTLELREAGLGARLLLAWPPARKKKWSDAEVHPDTQAGYEALIDRLAGLTASWSSPSPRRRSAGSRSSTTPGAKPSSRRTRIFARCSRSWRHTRPGSPSFTIWSCKPRWPGPTRRSPSARRAWRPGSRWPVGSPPRPSGCTGCWPKPMRRRTSAAWSRRSSRRGAMSRFGSSSG